MVLLNETSSSSWNKVWSKPDALGRAGFWTLTLISWVDVWHKVVEKNEERNTLLKQQVEERWHKRKVQRLKWAIFSRCGLLQGQTTAIQYIRQCILAFTVAIKLKLLSLSVISAVNILWGNASLNQPPAPVHFISEVGDCFTNNALLAHRSSMFQWSFERTSAPVDQLMNPQTGTLLAFTKRLFVNITSDEERSWGSFNFTATAKLSAINKEARIVYLHQHNGGLHLLFFIWHFEQINCQARAITEITIILRPWVIFSNSPTRRPEIFVSLH